MSDFIEEGKEVEGDEGEGTVSTRKRKGFVGVKSDGRQYFGEHREAMIQGELNKLVLDWDFLNSPDVVKRQRLGEVCKAEISGYKFRELMKAVPWGEVRGKYRKAFCMFAPQVDMALIKKAVKGDTKAIELFYTRMEGWTPRTGIDVTASGGDVRRLDTKELMGELMKTMTDEERRGLIERGELPSNGQSGNT